MLSLCWIDLNFLYQVRDARVGDKIETWVATYANGKTKEKSKKTQSDSNRISINTSPAFDRKNLWFYRTMKTESAKKSSKKKAKGPLF